MSLEIALRLSEILLALAFIQQSAEHLRGLKDERPLFLVRIGLSLMLLFGIQTAWVCLALVFLSLLILKRFQAPYNGGSDRMGLLILCSLSLINFMPSLQWQEYIFGYLAFQVILSYFMAGWVKITNPEWRRGYALRNVFLISVYPVSENIRKWAQHPQLLLVVSWAVIIFELLFPLLMLTQTTLFIGLGIAIIFHVTNACLFGLNRFIWVWIAAYPSIIWLHFRIFDGELLF